MKNVLFTLLERRGGTSRVEVWVRRQKRRKRGPEPLRGLAERSGEQHWAMEEIQDWAA